MEDVEITVVRLLLELASATLNHLDICYLEKSTLTVVHVFPDESMSHSISSKHFSLTYG